MTRQYLSARLKAGETVYAAWVGSPSLAMAEAVAQASWDAVVVDMQHGAVGVESMIDLVGGVVRAGKPAMQAV
jgi:4-hydroxy-2-oxoheptanedioate aldolase